MPVVYRNESYFAHSLTSVLSTNSTKMPCSSIFPPYYQLESGTYCGPKWTLCQDSPRLKVDTPKLMQFPFMVTSIYSEEAIKNYTLQVHGRMAEESVLNDITMGSVLGISTDRSYGFLKDVAVVDAITSHLLFGPLHLAWEVVQLVFFTMYYPYAIAASLSGLMYAILYGRKRTLAGTVSLLFNVFLEFVRLPFRSVVLFVEGVECAQQRDRQNPGEGYAMTTRRPEEDEEDKEDDGAAGGAQGVPSGNNSATQVTI